MSEAGAALGAPPTGPAQHGWCTTDAPVYDEAQAERAWARMLALFARRL